MGLGSWAAALVCAPGALGGRRDVMYIVPSLAAVLGPTGQNLVRSNTPPTAIFW